MKKTALICGSYAFDSIMVFNDRFKNHILPDKIHILNVSFQVPNLRKELGGCAGNIAYSLHLLGDKALPMATVGEDFLPYQKRLNALGIDQRYIKTHKNSYTAQAFITTDQDDNQITAFHPGAMQYSHLNIIKTQKPLPDIAIISPDGKQGMVEHAKQLYQLNIPFIFDPGQGLPLFKAAQLHTFIKQASWISVNDYELALLMDKTQLSRLQIIHQVKALIVTKGAKGSSVYYDNQAINIKAIKSQSVDPTGCGDAYRAGLIYGISRNFDWRTTLQLANLIAAIKVSTRGTQNHWFDQKMIAQHYQNHYQSPLPILSTA